MDIFTKVLSRTMDVLSVPDHQSSLLPQQFRDQVMIVFMFSYFHRCVALDPNASSATKLFVLGLHNPGHDVAFFVIDEHFVAVNILVAAFDGNARIVPFLALPLLLHVRTDRWLRDVYPTQPGPRLLVFTLRPVG